METKVKKPTLRQRKGAIAIVKNALSDNPLPTGQVLESVSYGKISKQPSRVVDSPGFQTAIQDVLQENGGLRKALEAEGINPKKIAEKIKVLLDHEEYQAVDKGISHATKIYGIIDDQPKSPSGNTYNFIFSPAVQDRVKAIEAEIKTALIQKHAPSEEN